MGETQVVLGARLHRAGDVDEQQHLARPHAPLEARQLDDFAVVARRVAQRAAQVDHGAAPARASDGSSAASAGAAAASRVSRRSASPVSAGPKRRSTSASARVAAWPIRSTSSALERFVLAAPVLLDADTSSSFALRQVLAFRAEEMHVEQRVIGGVALGRRGERREAGVADVLEIARPQQADRREERRRLLRRDREAVGAQQRDEGEEGLARRAAADRLSLMRPTPPSCASRRPGT